MSRRRLRAVRPACRRGPARAGGPLPTGGAVPVPVPAGAGAGRCRCRPVPVPAGAGAGGCRCRPPGNPNRARAPAGRGRTARRRPDAGRHADDGRRPTATPTAMPAEAGPVALPARPDPSPCRRRPDRPATAPRGGRRPQRPSPPAGLRGAGAGPVAASGVPLPTAGSPKAPVRRCRRAGRGVTPGGRTATRGAVGVRTAPRRVASGGGRTRRDGWPRAVGNAQ